MTATAVKPKIYDPAIDPRVSFEDAVAYYMREFGTPRAQAELSVQMKREGGDNTSERRLPDGTILVQES